MLFNPRETELYDRRLHKDHAIRLPISTSLHLFCTDHHVRSRVGFDFLRPVAATREKHAEPFGVDGGGGEREGTLQKDRDGSMAVDRLLGVNPFENSIVAKGLLNCGLLPS